MDTDHFFQTKKGEGRQNSASNSKHEFYSINVSYVHERGWLPLLFKEETALTSLSSWLLFHLLNLGKIRTLFEAKNNL